MTFSRGGRPGVLFALTSIRAKERSPALRQKDGRYPARLLKQINADRIMPSVWEAPILSRTVRILVLSAMTLEQRNAVLAFFSFDADKVRYALDNYARQQDDGSTVINQLLDQYALEGIGMPYTMEHVRKDYIRAHISELPPEEVLARFAPEDRLKGREPHVIEAYLERLKKRQDPMKLEALPRNLWNGPRRKQEGGVEPPFFVAGADNPLPDSKAQRRTVRYTVT